LLAEFDTPSTSLDAIRIWQGFPHVGRFDVQNVAVTRRTD
jgi:hypothetical protein